MKRYSSALLALSLLLGGVGTAAHQPPPAQAATELDWHPIVANPLAGYNFCPDRFQPNIALVNKADGTYAANWVSGVQTLVNARPLTVCGRNGWIYSRPDNSPVGTTTWRFNSRDPQGQAIAHLPTATAEDGSDLVYALENHSGTAPGHLWVSSDAGLTWIDRDTTLLGPIQSMVVAATDGGIIYVVTADLSGQNRQGPLPYTVWASTDDGVSWERRLQATADQRAGIPTFSLRLVRGAASPVDLLELDMGNGVAGGSGAQTNVLVSGDGARTFHEVGFNHSAGNESQVNLFYDGAALLRQSVGNRFGANAPVEQSTDGGVTWTQVPLPPLPSSPSPTPGLGQPTAPFYLDTVLAPGVIVVSGPAAMWVSTDRTTWTRISDQATSQRAPIFATPYLPLTVFDLVSTTDGPQIAWATFPTAAAGQAFVRPVAASHASGSQYFAQTGHNLSALFADYWTDHGGLAQFGYPRTEAFPEVSATDGHIYWTQYFERNRFEYHPENSGSPYRVLLGLLGNDLTATRRTAGEAPFTAVPDPHQPGVTLFAPTGHTLRGPFAAYWQAHGGLAIYGYPISEEFGEVSPTDGHSYTVQYFERNRFELHPEHAGTPYEVLLGLLGNTLIQQRGWER